MLSFRSFRSDTNLKLKEKKNLTCDFIFRLNFWGKELFYYYSNTLFKMCYIKKVFWALGKQITFSLFSISLFHPLAPTVSCIEHSLPLRNPHTHIKWAGIFKMQRTWKSSQRAGCGWFNCSSLYVWTTKAFWKDAPSSPHCLSTCPDTNWSDIVVQYYYRSTQAQGRARKHQVLSIVKHIITKSCGPIQQTVFNLSKFCPALLLHHELEIRSWLGLQTPRETWYYWCLVWLKSYPRASLE